MERPERIVLFMIGTFTNRMAAVMWVIGALSIVTVVNRIQYTYLELNGRPQPRRTGPLGVLVRAFYWTDERATLPYDLWVIAILAFVWHTPPDWLGDPMAAGARGLLQWIMETEPTRPALRNGDGSALRRCPWPPSTRSCDNTRRCVRFAGPPHTMQIASVFVMYSAVASSCGIGSNGTPR